MSMIKCKIITPHKYNDIIIDKIRRNSRRYNPDRLIQYLNDNFDFYRGEKFQDTYSIILIDRFNQFKYIIVLENIY